MKNYWKLIRTKHYVKNILVWTALFCSGELLQPGKLLSAVCGFFAFCFMCSVIYVINDIMDVEKDRQHPVKRSRPIASGAVSVRNAWILAAVLFALSMACNAIVFRVSGLVILLLYLGINLGYCFGLKNFPIWDLVILSLGALLRVFYGSAVTACALSPWMYLTVLCVTLFLTISKRRNERNNIADGSTREVLKYYTIPFIDKVMPICGMLTIAFFALWCRDEATLALHLGEYMVAAVPLLIFLFIKALMLMETPSDNDPIDVYLHDTAVLILFSAFIASLIVLPIL